MTEVDRIISKNEPITVQTMYRLARSIDIKLPIIKYIRDMPNVIAPGKYVMNMDNLYRGGTHYVAMVRKPGLVLYYDSFGVEPPTELVRRLGDDELWHHTDQVQDFDSNMCGLYCLHFLRHVDSLPDYRGYFHDYINESPSSRAKSS